MQNIKLELPLDAKVLARASTFLRGCADDLACKPVNAGTVSDGPVAVASLFDESHTAGVEDGTTTATADGHSHTETDTASEYANPITSEANSSEDTQATGDNPLLSIAWDERIHSSGKTRYASNSGAGKAKGQWIYKRGTKPEDAAPIEAELLASDLRQDSGDGELQTANINEADAAEKAFAAETDAADKAFGNDTAATETVTTNTEARAISNFPELMSLIHEIKAAGKVDDEGLNAKAMEVAGVPSIALMVTKMDFIPALGLALQAL